jgi:hypothetical protein
MWAISTFVQNFHVQDLPTCRQRTLRILLLVQAVVELTVVLSIVLLIIRRLTKSPTTEMEHKLRYQNCVRVLKCIIIAQIMVVFALMLTIVIIYSMDYDGFVSVLSTILIIIIDDI